MNNLNYYPHNKNKLNKYNLESSYFLFGAAILTTHPRAKKKYSLRHWWGIQDRYTVEE
jgi:hypothetical protein